MYAKMHFGIKCIFASNAFWRTFSKGKCSASNAFLHSITFYFVKCSASHFPKENVQHQQNVRAAQKTPNTAFLQNKGAKCSASKT